MAKIQPTISFTSNSNSVTTNPGPGSVSVAASIADSLDVDLMEQKLIATSTTQQRILDGYVLGGATKTPGTVGCFIFMRNNDTTTGNNILVGIVSNSRIHVAVADDQTTITGTNNPLAPHEDNEGSMNTSLEDGDGVALAAEASTGDSRLTVTTRETLRTFTLLPGEFAWFPYDYNGDIYVQAAQNTPALEYWRWDRA